MVTLKPIFLAGALAAALLGCNQGDKAGSGGGEAASTNQRATLAGLKRQLDDVADRITALGERAGQAGAKVERSTQDDIERLEKARDDLYMRLGSLQTATAETWQDLKSNAVISIDSLSRAADRTWKKVTGEERSASAED